MIYYDRTLQITETEFNTCQEEVKTAIRQIVDRYKAKHLEILPSVTVKFMTSLKGSKLQEAYNLLETKYHNEFVKQLKKDMEQLKKELDIPIYASIIE